MLTFNIFRREAGRERGAALLGVLLAVSAAAGACSKDESTAGTGGGKPSPTLVGDKPVDGLTAEQTADFNDGDHLFDLVLHDGDGLGPLYSRSACGACHAGALSGPGVIQKMSVVEADGITPSLDQSKLPFGNTVHPLLSAGAKTPIVPPDGDPSIRVTVRIAPPVVGRGYIEAVLDSEIERKESEQASRTDEIHGRINHVVYQSEANPDTRFHTHQKGDAVIGRFGLKARIATLDDFVAEAFQNDIGITSPLRPSEIVNPDGLTDDLKPGVDVGIDSVNLRAGYLRMLAIPRTGTPPRRGEVLFASANCTVCHAPSLKTRSDYPIAALAGIDAPIYSDLLLHDMGEGLADGLPKSAGDGDATAREWRTAPLIGMGLIKTFLHDGRAKSIDAAIRAHDNPGSTAAGPARIYEAMSSEDAAALVEFVTSL